MNEAQAIDVHGISKVYRGGLFGRRKFRALNEVSLAVGRGEIFGLLGPNGAGKTTLIKVLLGIIRNNGGSGSLLGESLGSRGSRGRIGYLPENLRMDSHHNALSALDFYGGLSGLSRSVIRSRRDSILELVGLADRRKTPVKEYSKGMRQRLGLAQALLHDPDLLVLDEPTDGLDPVGRNQIRGILRELRERGKTVFLNSHILQEVELICDRIGILNHGVLLMDSGVAALSQQDTQEFTLEVVADEPTLLGVLGEIPFTVNEQHDGVTKLSLRLSDQGEVDQVVDILRRAGISIAAMSRRTLSLEERFLDIVGTSNDDTSETPNDETSTPT
ncbi:MAG TPA: ABC transporter ATP-binding protein [Planctomycetes bacterium]|jgi:ABC-2 type transport system ATP-binding protein|nr:ABC transporter ATP-binding protein [Planctomycetota bacterium]